MSIVDDLMSSERRLATGAGTDYDAVLHDDALVIVPGAVLDKQECVAAMDASPGWDSVDLREPRLLRTAETATVVYSFIGQRGSTTYEATLASTYVRQDDTWRLLVHQQTAG
ncbi:nuclear transport factor 2 family protein [Sanguibacter sp. 25GB23B1]|uniref:nuclear transport factor 2 family protein n=1 Tax=unclassified Sanguibacter TaxID=2645534 RepID=UPI0032AF604E